MIHALKHIIIIALIIIILFPMFWIITTSVRRDNAAFSTKLVSNRYTLQYYKDLLLNKKNVPQLISQMKMIINLSSEYSSMSKEELLETLNRTETELVKQLDLSIKQVEDANEYVRRIVDFTDSKKDSFIVEFEAIKTQEREFYERELEEIINSSQSVYTRLSMDMIENIDEVSGKERTKYLYILSSSSPLFVEEYEGLVKSLNNHIEFLDKEYSAWIESYGNKMGEELKAQTRQIQDEFKELIKSGGFSYSKWNREINLKGYMGLRSQLQTELSETDYNSWQDLTTLFKATAKEIDNVISEYEMGKQEILETLKSSIGSQEELTQEYLQLEAERKLLYDSAVSMENKLEGYQLEIMDLEDKIAILTDKMEKALYELNQMKDIFAVELSKEPSEIAGNPQRLQTLMISIESLISDIQAMGDISKGSQTIRSAWDTLAWFTKNESRISSHIGYETLENGINVLHNAINPIKNDIEDFALLNERYKQIQTDMEQVQIMIAQGSEELDQIQKKSKEAYPQYANIMEEEKKVKKALGLISLGVEVEGVSDYESLSKYSTKLSTFVNSMGIIENPAKKALSDMASFDKLVYLKKNYFDEAAYLSETVLKIKELLARFDQKKKTYINLIHANVMIKVEELDDIDTIQKTAYNRFSSQLNKIGRIASDLSERPFYSEISGDLEKIDKNIFESMQFWIKKPEQQFMRWLINTIILAVVTAGLTVLICSLGAYPFSRMRFPGRKHGLLFLLLIQMFPIVMGMVALYLLLRFIGQFLPGFGLDSLWGLGLIYLGNIAFNMWLLKGYFDTIPDSLEEAAMIDGSTRFQTFWRIIIPLTAPMLAVVFLIVFMANFNEFVLASVVLQSPRNYTFAVGLQSFSYGAYQMEWGLFTAAALIGALPMVILSLSLQRYLVSGLTSGAVKG